MLHQTRAKRQQTGVGSTCLHSQLRLFQHYVCTPDDGVAMWYNLCVCFMFSFTEHLRWARLRLFRCTCQYHFYSCTQINEELEHTHRQRDINQKVLTSLRLHSTKKNKTSTCPTLIKYLTLPQTSLYTPTASYTVRNWRVRSRNGMSANQKKFATSPPSPRTARWWIIRCWMRYN